MFAASVAFVFAPSALGYSCFGSECSDPATAGYQLLQTTSAVRAGLAVAQPVPAAAAWPCSAHDNANTGHSQHVLALNGSPTVVWTADLSGGAIASVSIDQDDSVYAVDAAGRAVSIDRGGKLRWMTEPYGAVGGGPTVLGRSGDGTDDGGWQPYDTMYLGTGGGEIIGLRATDGSEIFRFDAGQGPVTSQVIVRNSLSLNAPFAYFATGRTVTALNMSLTGGLPTPRYSYDFGDGQVTGIAYAFCGVVASSSANGGALVNLNPHRFPGYPPTPGDTYCKDIDSNKYTITMPHGTVATIPPEDLAIGSSEGFIVVVSTEEGTVECVDARTGERVWTFALPAGARPTKDSAAGTPGAELLFVGGDDGVLYALDFINGTLTWSLDVGAPIVSRVAVDAASNVVVAAGRDVVAVSAQGELVGRFQGETAVTTPPSINGQGHVVYGDGGGVRCLRF